MRLAVSRATKKGKQYMAMKLKKVGMSSKASVPQLTNTAVGEFKGNVLLNFEPEREDDFGLKMGPRKLQAVLDNLDDVREFLRVYPYVPKGKGARK